MSGLEVEIPPFTFGVTNNTPEYRAKFPLGKIPSFDTADGTVALYESNAIAYYLCSAGPHAAQLLGRDQREQALVQQWIFFSELQLEKDYHPLLIMALGFMPFDAAAEERGIKEVGKWLAHIETHLAGRTWLVTDDQGPSLADLTVGGVICFAAKAHFDAEDRARYPNIMAWYTRLREVEEIKDLFAEPMIEKRKSRDCTSA